MGIFDTLKGLFGGSNHNVPPDSYDQPPVNHFIKPDWAYEDDESDDDLIMRSPPNNFAFSVFFNAPEFNRFFQSFEEASKDLGIFGPNGFFDNSLFRQSPLYRPDQMPAIVVPSDETETHGGSSLRDKCLKPDARGRFPSNVDSDLDNEFKNGRMSLFKSPDASARSLSTPQVYSSQVFTRIIRRPDGSMEEVRTKQVGDQKYTKIIRTDSAGQTSVHEDIVNIDEDKLKSFQSIGETPLPRLDFHNWFRFRL